MSDDEWPHIQGCPGDPSWLRVSPCLERCPVRLRAERDTALASLAAVEAQLGEATDLLHDWEASATIETPPELLARTTVYLHHPKATPASPPVLLDPVNQCDGCQRRLPTKPLHGEAVLHFDPVEDGESPWTRYLIVCTKDRYRASRSPSHGVGPREGDLGAGRDDNGISAQKERP